VANAAVGDCAERWSNDDSKEKSRLDDLWVLKIGGKCLFVMLKERMGVAD